MLNITCIKNYGSTKMSLDYLRASEGYTNYLGAEQSTARLLGKGSDALALTAPDDETMLALANGFAPDGRKLAKNAGSEKRRIGYDFTFSADKSVSLVFAQADGVERERILEAHHKAVNTAFDFLEGLAETRRGHAGAQKLGVSGLVATGHTHFGSRSLDPQIHEHVLLYSVAQGTDGKWSTFDPDQLMRYRNAAGALYRAELAQQMQHLGYGIEKTIERDAFDRPTGQVFFQVAGVDQTVRDEFSKRRAAILEHQAEFGGSAQAACLATRKKKDEPTFQELDQIWKESLQHLKATHPHLVKSNAELKQCENVVQSASDAAILESVHQRNAVFSRPELIERLAMENVGLMDAKAVLADADRFAKDLAQSGQIYTIAPEVLKVDRVGEPAARYREERYAASWMVKMEQGIGKAALARREDQSVRLDPKQTWAVVGAYEQEHKLQLTDEQKLAVMHVTCETGGTAVLTGLAGTGKTTVSRSFVQAFQDAGCTVLGVSTGWDAAKKLEAEAGIAAVSAASMLKQLSNGSLELTAKHVVVLDEAGMAGTVTISKLQKAVDKAGAKLVLMGDHQQLQPIEAGGAFRLAKQSVGSAKLTEIRRQKSQSDRSTAKALYGNAGEAFSQMQSNNQVKEHETRKEALAAMATDYLASSKPDREKLALVSTHAEAKRFNDQVRSGLKATGALHGPQHQISAKTGRVLEIVEVGCGERIRFTQKDASLGVFNGNAGVIESVHIHNGAHVLSVRLESEIKGVDGRRVVIDTSKFNSFAHNYALTVHKSQGQGRSEVFQLCNPQMTDMHTALVGFTRMKEKFSLYGSAEELGEFKNKMGMERLKENAIEAGLKAPAESNWKETLLQWVKQMRERMSQGQAVRQAPLLRRGAEFDQKSGGMVL